MNAQHSQNPFDRTKNKKMSNARLFVFLCIRLRDSNPKGRCRQMSLSGGQANRLRCKPTERGGAARRMRSIRKIPSTAPKQKDEQRSSFCLFCVYD